jgi:mannose-6-phosphate isomerase-like protein (cupin superfamily)
MKQVKLKTNATRAAFKVLAEGGSSQAALMVLAPGESTSERPENEHPRAEQWLYVIAGTGRARSGGRAVGLAAGSLLFIPKGEPHQVTNTGRSPLVTLNVYAPPAYTKDGEVRRSVRAR